MKVLWFHSGVGATGGGFKAMLYTLNALRERSVRSSVVCTESSDVVQALESQGYPVILSPSIRKWPTTVMANSMWTLGGMSDLVKLPLSWRSSVNAARRIICSEKPDIVHINMAPLVPPAAAAQIEGVPVVWHVREELNIRSMPIPSVLNRRAIQRFSNFVISINQENLQQLGNLSRASVIYDSVPLDEFDRGLDGSAFRCELGCSDDTILVGALNHVSWIKGSLILARAAKVCLEANKNIMFLVVGEYEYPAHSWKQRLKRRLARVLHLHRYVEQVMDEIHEERKRGFFKFVGPLMDVRYALAALDILVFPSLTSHSPLPAIEAGAMARPVIASDWPAVREVITQGKNGLLVPPGDHVALAKEILTLAEDRGLRSQLGENGYRQVLERFDLRKNSEQLLSIYQKVLSEPVHA